MNICFETFGCRLNRAEALEAEAKAIAQGHKIVTEHSKADAFVIRGCSVTARAQHDCEKLIAHLKHKYPNKRMIVQGCLANAEKTLKIPAAPLLASKPIPVPTRTARAYLKVQDGCAGTCTFCIVPKFRGKSVSEDFAAVLDKARRFIESGYREIIVTGCNLALYASNGKHLPDLLAALSDLDANCRIRLGSLEPWGCADEVVDVIAEHANICRFLHIPVQSGSDRILRLMNRPYKIVDVQRIVKKAQELMPMIGLGCDLMTGFPGENDGDFTLTKKILTQLPFSRAHIFHYSERPGTPAAKLPGSIPRDTRKHRAHKLDKIVAEKQMRFAKQFVGKEVEVVIESHHAQPKGWTGEYLWFEGPVRPTAHERTLRKQLVRFVVRSTTKGILHGVQVDDGR